MGRGNMVLGYWRRSVRTLKAECQNVEDGLVGCSGRDIKSLST
jgi:hypothetical protein